MDPLPPGYFYSGYQYVNIFGDKSNIHPSILFMVIFFWLCCFVSHILFKAQTSSCLNQSHGRLLSSIDSNWSHNIKLTISQLSVHLFLLFCRHCAFSLTFLFLQTWKSLLKSTLLRPTKRLNSSTVSWSCRDSLTSLIESDGICVHAHCLHLFYLNLREPLWEGQGGHRGLCAKHSTRMVQVCSQHVSADTAAAESPLSYWSVQLLFPYLVVWPLESDYRPELVTSYVFMAAPPGSILMS